VLKKTLKGSIMTDARVMMLEGSDGFSFFFQETLLEQGVAKQVDRVSLARQAIALIKQSDPYHAYDLIIIDLVESWEEGMQLGFWLNQQSSTCPIILIVPPDTSTAPLTKARFTAVLAPFSLNDFTDQVRQVLSTANRNGDVTIGSSQQARTATNP
jgi:DNA-binding NtrC family response regulator